MDIECFNIIAFDCFNLIILLILDVNDIGNRGGRSDFYVGMVPLDTDKILIFGENVMFIGVYMMIH